MLLFLFKYKVYKGNAFCALLQLLTQKSAKAFSLRYSSSKKSLLAVIREQVLSGENYEERISPYEERKKIFPFSKKIFGERKISSAQRKMGREGNHFLFLFSGIVEPPRKNGFCKLKQTAWMPSGFFTQKKKRASTTLFCFYSEKPFGCHFPIAL
ncbi:MAG: hypothetical protein J5814_00975 [Bacteroidaceae bacterium]|nr:hypothetical protein [Bacteroidaceae bacterium]